MKNKKSLFVLFTIITTALVVAACGGSPVQPTSTFVPPTETAVSDTRNTVSSGGIELKVISAAKQDTYDLGGQVFTPNSPDDECLIVEAAINGGDPESVQGWAISITDEHGRKSESNLTSIQTYTASKDTTIMWLFVVARTSQSLTLTLPDGQGVVLGSLIE